ncbi:MAG: phosphatidyl-myo-inositol alpha-mannosyltransferase [Cryptosporangiaceae bacterium]|nr:phosphatidyl-myo-inositol alpha-mannosyltransferase [Cryptosporangiaceae bacterium]
MRVGIVCPYSFDVPGGVQAHVRDLAEALIGLGHHVSVLAPADEGEALPPYVVAAGRAMPIRYNGSVARLSINPMAIARVRRWLREGEFEVLHVHEPVAPMLSLLATMIASGPIVATFHTATPRSRMLAAAQGALQPVVEKISGRIAVSALARRVQVEHLAGGAVEIPNGVSIARFEAAAPLDGWPGEGGAIGFLGRFTEPRKGFPILLDAFARIAPDHPGLRLLVAGPGDAAEALDDVPADLRDRIVMLGLVSDEDKARMLRSVDVYVAPNTGGESFGMILTEAMAAGTPIAASDLDAFRRVLSDGKSGALFRTGDAADLASVLGELLGDPRRRSDLARAAREAVEVYDWPHVASQVLDVYSMAIAANPLSVTDDDDTLTERLMETLREWRR